MIRMGSFQYHPPFNFAKQRFSNKGTWLDCICRIYICESVTQIQIIIWGLCYSFHFVVLAQKGAGSAVDCGCEAWLKAESM